MTVTPEFARHFTEGYAKNTQRLSDFPVFSGKYSTVSYLDETVHAVYGVLSQTAGKFQLQAGLRAEQASRAINQVSLFGESEEPGSAVSLVDSPRWTDLVKLQNEKSALGGVSRVTSGAAEATPAAPRRTAAVRVRVRM